MICRKVKSIFCYKKQKQYQKILVCGGYGYKNAGDEAQLNASLNLLKKNFPDHMRVVLTHDRQLTHKEHAGCQVFESPREAFYDCNRSGFYWLPKSSSKAIFLFISILIYLNAYLVRSGLPTFLINAKKAALLEELKSSDLLFYSGGGYMTGKTQSRLWDSMFFISIASVLDVPVVLSGQTIGVWNGKFNKRLAKWGLSKARIISVRDPEDSITALKSIGLQEDNILVTCDDALNCSIADIDTVKETLSKSGLSEKDQKNYVVVNIHYWSVKPGEARERLLSRVKLIIDHIVSQGRSVVLIPMVPGDIETLKDYQQRYSDPSVHLLSYEFDFKVVRGVIAQATLCITMKHHPIIFAIGEKVPVISLAYSDYYEHKNGGALRLFGLQSHNLLFDDSFKISVFIRLYKRIFENLEEEAHLIEKYTKEADRKRGIFWQRIRECIDNSTSSVT